MSVGNINTAGAGGYAGGVNSGAGGAGSVISLYTEGSLSVNGSLLAFGGGGAGGPGANTLTQTGGTGGTAVMTATSTSQAGPASQSQVI